MDEQRKQFTNIYIKNLDPEVTEDDLREIFSKFGPITSAVLQVDPDGKSRGFGFVNFDSHIDAANAVDALHDTEVNGRKLFVARAQKKAEREEELRKSYEDAKMEKLSKYQGVNLYVKNLDDDIDDDKLRAEFEPFGTITSAKVMRDDKDHSKGFGFVCYSGPEEATKAVAEMNNKMIGSKPLYVSLAQRRDARRQQLESQIAQRNQIRMQQAAAAGIPGGYTMYYPPAPPGNNFPPPGSRGMMSYGQPGMAPPRPRYNPNQQMPNMIPPGPYSQPPPQGYTPGYRGPPRPPQNGGPGQPNPGGRQPGPQPGQPQRGGGPPPSNRPQNKPPQQRNGTAPTPASPIGHPPDAPQPFNPATLANVPPMEQKQMLGEILYVRIAP